jgi:hypothetical protein
VIDGMGNHELAGGELVRHGLVPVLNLGTVLAIA